MRSIPVPLLFIAAVAVPLAVVSAAASSWPVKAAFALSRPQLETLAGQVEAGESVQTPTWAGVIRVEQAELNDRGVVCLWTDTNPAGAIGFVRHGPEDLPFNLWSHTVVSSEWQWIQED